jgi:ribose transport system substrate-binding protein
MKTILLVALASLGLSLSAADPYVIAFVPKGSTHEYWKSMEAGARQAAAELTASGTPVKLVWKGPLREDDRDVQIQVVENFVGQQVSGIVIAPLDSHALVRPIEEAVASGIPVVTVDTPLDSTQVSALIATDNREGGRIAARQLGKLLGGKGNVILLRVDATSTSTGDREEGFLEVMRRDFPGVTLLSTDQHAGVTRDTARTVSENLLNRFGLQVNGIFASNESAAAGMLLALTDAGLGGGKVKFVAFDSGQALLAGLKAGDVQALVVQDPQQMGYLGVKTMVAILRHEKYSKTIDTGVTVKTRQ